MVPPCRGAHSAVERCRSTPLQLDCWVPEGSCLLVFGFGVPEQRGIVVERWIPLNAVDLPLAYRQGVVLAAGRDGRVEDHLTARSVMTSDDVDFVTVTVTSAGLFASCPVGAAMS